ncbi:hypothetical protein EJ04DRAFT_466897, partial [Polyplosphaeria fusca]
MAHLNALTALATEPTCQASQGVSEQRLKRRDRACFSCTRCHRLKVKCDKKRPSCGRCAKSGFCTSCIYTHQVASTDPPTSPASPFVLAGEDPDNVVASWLLRKRSSSHWRSLMLKLESLNLVNSTWFMLAVREHSQGDCAKDFTLPGNFPFGSQESAKYMSHASVYALLQASRIDCQTYIDCYLGMYQVIYPILDTETFVQEVEAFWEKSDEDVDVSWLAQFLLVLGLGCFVSSRDAQKATDFFFASEACLSKTPYMFRPTMVILRTLCLMVISKQVANATCWALDSCWNMMGLIIRIAIMMSLHQDREPLFGMVEPERERNLRRRLWTTICYFDIQLSLITGQPSLLPCDIPPMPADQSQAAGLLTLDDCWTTVLPEMFPMLYRFLSRINSRSEEISYDEILQYNMVIRRTIGHLTTVDGPPLLRLTLDIFFRRVLLVLHRQKALDDEAPAIYPISYWSSLECSLAMLVHHQNLSEGSGLSGNVDLIQRPFMLDFFAAIITASVHLLRYDAPLTATFSSESFIPPRQTIVGTLLTCQGILAREKDKSVCFRTGCELLNEVLKLVP